MREIKIFFILLIMGLPLTKCYDVGTFFWKPRLGLDLAIPTTETSFKVHQPSKQAIADGLVVMIDGYAAGITVIALAAGASSGRTTYPHLNPLSAYYYTTMYRWGLRYFSLIPFWLGGHGGNYVETHRVWKRRFYYMDEFVPDWLKNVVPFVKKEEWDQEHLDWRRFKKYAEPAFGKHYRYPTKQFKDFKSHMTVETVENLDMSSNSL